MWVSQDLMIRYLIEKKNSLNLHKCIFRQTSFQRSRFSGMVHDRQSARRTRRQNSQTNLWNQRMSNISSIESTIAQFWCKQCWKYRFHHFYFNRISHFFFFCVIQQLPVKIYESIIDIVQGDATMLFVNLPYTLATEEAERIGVDHVVRMSTHENGGKSAGTLPSHSVVISISNDFFWPFILSHLVAEHLIAQHSAIKMLHSRVKLILSYIKSIENGTLPSNTEILREAYSLSQRLPVIQSSAFREEYYTVTFCKRQCRECQTNCLIELFILFFIHICSNRTMLVWSHFWVH